MNKILINCDLGEWEEREHTRALMQYTDLANIACGGHAGNEESIRECLDLCKQHNVLAGAHPGLAGERGRTCDHLHVEEFEESVHTQMLTFSNICAEFDIPINHIKLHGSLYHLTEKDPSLRDCYLQMIQRDFPDLTMVALSGGSVSQAAKTAGLNVAEEAFIDRAYLANQQLVPRDEAGAILHSEKEIQQRLHNLKKGFLLDRNGEALKLSCDTICVHSDTKNSLTIVRLCKKYLS